jgi:exonuclease SbcC
LPTEALPAEARTRLDQFARLSKALAESSQCEAKAAEHEGVVQEFEAKVARVGEAVGEAVGQALGFAVGQTVGQVLGQAVGQTVGRGIGQSVGRAIGQNVGQSTGQAKPEQGADVVAEKLYDALAAAREAHARLQQITSDIAREARTIEEEVVNAERARTALAELVQSAGCGAPEELPEIEARAARKLLLQQRLREIDEQLVQQNARPVEDIAAEAAGSTLDAVDRTIADAEGEIEALERSANDAQLAAYDAKQRFEAIDGGTAAAEAQQAMRSIAAQIANEARRYARARLASTALGRVVQLYREQHQGPLMQRAAEVFARITLGSFAGLVIDYDDDRQVLLGERPDATQVPVTGMSQGTRDQLFLSLRLAAIEQHIAGRGPFPVIVDDLLVQFDDDRALATLEVLSELSTKTQVLFFTHHRHLMELAQSSRLGSLISAQSL